MADASSIKEFFGFHFQLVDIEIRIHQANEMIPLESNRKVLTLMSVYPFDGTTNVLIKLICFIFPLVVLTIHLLAISSSAVFFATHIEDDMDTAIFAILQMSGCANMAYMLVIAIYLRVNINDIFQRLDEIYKTCKRFLS